MEKFSSKVDWAFVLIPFTILFSVLYIFIYSKLFWPSILLIIPIIVYLFNIFLDTYYIIEKKYLSIKCGMFYKKKILISNIIEINEVFDISNAPALSISRIEIRYDRNKSILLSPKNKSKFISLLKNMNPLIEF